MMQRELLIIFSIVIMLPKSAVFGFVFKPQKWRSSVETVLESMICFNKFKDKITKVSSLD